MGGRGRGEQPAARRGGARRVVDEHAAAAGSRSRIRWCICAVTCLRALTNPVGVAAADRAGDRPPRPGRVVQRPLVDVEVERADPRSARRTRSCGGRARRAPASTSLSRCFQAGATSSGRCRLSTRGGGARCRPRTCRPGVRPGRAASCSPARGCVPAGSGSARGPDVGAADAVEVDQLRDRALPAPAHRSQRACPRAVSRPRRAASHAACRPFGLWPAARLHARYSKKSSAVRSSRSLPVCRTSLTSMTGARRSRRGGSRWSGQLADPREQRRG